MNIPNNILEISRKLHTQDNRGSSHPVVEVRKYDPDIHVEIKVGGATFFTVEAAEAYIAENQRRHAEPLYAIIDSGWRNPEWQAVRDFLMSLTPSNTGA